MTLDLEIRISSSSRKAPAILTCFAAILLAVGGASVRSASADPSVTAKQRQAQDVLTQIRAIDGQLEHAVEAYNLATLRLGRIDADLKTNGARLVLAKTSLEGARKNLEQRLVSLYVNGSQSSAIEVLLGARSLDDMMLQLDTVERVSAQDASVLREVQAFKAEVRSRKARLEKARQAQAGVVADRAAQRSSIQGQLAERQRMLSSIKSEIASLQAAEARRQAQLEAQARARVAALSQQRGQSVPLQAEPDVGPTAAPEAVQAEAPAPANRYGGVVGIAMQYLGVPYVWGGASPSGFDCSGFSQYVYAQIGVSLPHHAASQYGMGSAVSRDALEPGDLVFFNGLGHMGIYIGGGQFVHAPHTGDVVKVSSLSDSWYAQTYVGARRL